MATTTTFTAKDVQELRQRTGAGMMECKKALQEAGGDLEQAKLILRERGLASAKKLAERSAGEGIVEAYLHQPDPTLPPKVGVMLELNCATDFVAKTEQFRQLARNIAHEEIIRNTRALARTAVETGMPLVLTTSVSPRSDAIVRFWAAG